MQIGTGKILKLNFFNCLTKLPSSYGSYNYVLDWSESVYTSTGCLKNGNPKSNRHREKRLGESGVSWNEGLLQNLRISPQFNLK